jgi:hypothetical protein
MWGDWMHCNTVDYNAQRDEIVLTSHNLHEIYVIDHSTTTAEAAGHTGGRRGKGGDILYRWGNPQVYGRGTSADRVFYVAHGANWIPSGLPGAGDIIVLNNGDRSGSSNDYSVITQITPPLDSAGGYYIGPDSAFGPTSPTWSYGPGTSFYSQHLGGAYRLPNGNTFAILGTSGRFVEVTEDGEVVWQYNAGGQVGRALKYDRDTVLTGLATGSSPVTRRTPMLTCSPNPFRQSTVIRYDLPLAGRVKLTVHDVAGRRLATLVDEPQSTGAHEARLDHTQAGVLLARLQTGVEGTESVETIRIVNGGAR